MLESIKEKIGKEHIVLPAIHALTTQQVIENLHIVAGEGADGFFLVNNKIPSQLLLEIHENIQGQFVDHFHGINDLGVSPQDTFRNIEGSQTKGVRVDNPRIQAVNGIDNTQEISLAKEETDRDGLYFGGVAFKYQFPIPGEVLPYAIEQAKSHMDVLTTSGSATGNAANIDEIKYFHKLAGGFPIALASGITPENIDTYLPYIDVSIVATGISKNFFDLDSKKLRELIKRCK